MTFVSYIESGEVLSLDSTTSSLSLFNCKEAIVAISMFSDKIINSHPKTSEFPATYSPSPVKKVILGVGTT